MLFVLLNTEFKQPSFLTLIEESSFTVTCQLQTVNNNESNFIQSVGES